MAVVQNVNILQTKVAFIRHQVQELHGLLDEFVDKEITIAASAADSNKDKNQDVSTVRQINSRLDLVLDFLLGKCAEIQNFTSGSVVQCQSQQLQSNETVSSNSSQDFQELSGHIAALELATSVVDKRTSDLVQTTDEQKIKFNTIEGKLKNLASEIANKDKMKTKKYESSEKKRKLQDSVVSSHAEKLEHIQSQLQNLISYNADLSQRLDTRLNSLTNVTTQIQNEYADVKSSLHEKEQEALLFKKITDDLKSDLQALKSEHNQVEISLADLSFKMCSHDITMDPLAVSRVNEENQITELQDKVHLVEEQRCKDLEYYTRKLEEIQSLYQQVCHMVDAKVTPLQRLQTILSKYNYKKELQETAAQQVAEDCEDVDSEPGAKYVGPQRQRVAVGFTAHWSEYTVISANSVIIFTDVLCNEGACYNTSTGVFTAPYNGLYLASLTLRQRGEGKVNAHIRVNKHRVFTVGREDTVCKVLTHADQTSSSDIGMVRVQAGDEILVRVMEAESTPRLSFYSGFSCVLIG